MSEDQLIADSLDRIEKKLDDLAAKVNQHQGAIGAIIWIGTTVLGLITMILGWMGVSRH